MMVYDCIVAYKRKHDGNSPSMRELSASLGITSLSMVRNYLKRLADLGLIRIPENGETRSIEIIGGSWSYHRPEKFDRVDPRQLSFKV